MEVFVAFYLVERYVPSMTAAELAAAMARIGELPGDEVRHVWTVLVRGEDTCLSVFEAPDGGAVEEANARASFHFDRVVEVTPLEVDRLMRAAPGSPGPGFRRPRFSGSTDARGTGRP
jgi:muconolactone delta-isomerase